MSSSSKIATEKELLEAIRDLLMKSGHLNKLQAEIRANITDLIRNQTKGDKKLSHAPQPTEEVLLVNELIREYLEWNGYLYTTSVMTSEASMPKDRKTRPELCLAVGVRDDEKSSALPLLSNIVAAYSERIKRKLQKNKTDYGHASSKGHAAAE